MKAYVPYDALPTWFNEGVATFIARAARGERVGSGIGRRTRSGGGLAIRPEQRRQWRYVQSQ
jgi:hypothetical protein